LKRTIEALKADFEIISQENMFIEQEREKEVKYYKERYEEKERLEEANKLVLKKEVETIK
jgi:predicted glycosyltransferase involved in capsule biosynthesis